MASTFKVGERVRFRSVEPPHVVGSVGTIVRVYRGEPPEYATVGLKGGAAVECRTSELEHAKAA